MSEERNTPPSAEQYPFQIKDWEHFQHFRDRRPPWVKLYRNLLDDPEYHALSGEAAKVLTMLWLLASETEGYLPDIKVISFRLRTPEKVISAAISELSHFVYQRDIKVISPRYHPGPLETETETETEVEKEKIASSLRSDGAPSSAEEPLTEPPWDDLPEEPIPPPARTFPVAAPPTPKPPDPSASAESQMFARARALMGPQGGMVLGRMKKMWPGDWLKIHHVLKAAEALNAPQEDTKKYCLGALAKEKKLREIADKEAEAAAAWRPTGTDYPQNDERGFYIHSPVDNSRRVYLDGDKVQTLVGAERERRRCF